MMTNLFFQAFSASFHPVIALTIFKENEYDVHHSLQNNIQLLYYTE
jgi:hypothetical protein